jgi:hypothetical protein
VFESVKHKESRWDVFICYCWDENEMVNGFCEMLDRRGVNYFRDNRELKPGDGLFERLTNEIRCSAFFVPFYSPGYLRSEACLHEFSTALLMNDLTSRPHFFPILARPVALTRTMRDRLYEDCTHDSEQRLPAACSRLIERLSGEGA